MKEKSPFKKVVERKKTTREGPMCHIYLHKDFQRYIECTMNDAEIRKFEAHCHHCLSCAKNLVNIVQETVAANQQEEMEFYYQKTMQYLDELNKKNPHIFNK